MRWFDLFWHVVGLLMPALVVAPGVVLAGWLMGGRHKKKGQLRRWAVRVAINLGVCLGVLLSGLVLTAHDGRMATYTVLLLASASTEWMLLRRRSS